MIARHALFRGLVQGVGFRWQARERARERGLHGWVRNLRDGRVELVAEGSLEEVEAFLTELAGPGGPGHVVEAKRREVPCTQAAEFAIRENGDVPEV